MPHLTVHAAETDLAGNEARLITAVTDAVVAVYGEWARPIAAVRLVGIQQGRWGRGGVAAPEPAPDITFGIKAAACDQRDVITRLATGVTDAVAGILGRHDEITIEFVGTLPGRSALGGVVS